jgi:hypothetical protein
MVNISQIRTLLREGRSVVLVEDGQPPLVVTELAPPVRAREEEIPIASRWPKVAVSSDQVLERLNKEILALKAQIADDVDFQK